jgi:tRNA A37 threonylcarbamoyltransferase TsaD
MCGSAASFPRSRARPTSKRSTRCSARPSIAREIRFRDLDGIAVTVVPGADRVNHLEGHLWANFVEHGAPDPPYVALASQAATRSSST